MGFRRLPENQAHRSKISTNEAQWYYPTDGPFT